jgi:hypothetical protein
MVISSLKVIVFTSIYSNILFATFSSHIFFLAQKSPSYNCSEALEVGKNRLASIKNIQKVSMGQYNVSQQYPDHPINRPQRYSYAMKGAAVPAVMASPKLMENIAQNIIGSCETVGSVTFSLAQSGWGISVGLSTDGSVKVFKCLDYDRNEQKNLLWGEEYCSV